MYINIAEKVSGILTAFNLCPLFKKIHLLLRAMAMCPSDIYQGQVLRYVLLGKMNGIGKETVQFMSPGKL